MSRSVCAIDKDVVPASFKGVPFYCTEADAEGGRRGAEGEFPFGEHTAYADLGRKIRTYRLTAFFREDDHVWDSHALFVVCESPGPGILVHPTRGSVMVACRSVKVRDALEDSAGETSVEMEFVEANVGFSGIIGSLFGLVSTALFNSSRTSFLRDYTPIHVPHPWVVDVVNKAQHLVHVTGVAAAQILPVDAPTSEWRDVLRMEEVATDDGLALSAATVDDALSDGFFLLARSTQEPLDKFNTFRRLANYAAVTPNLPHGPAINSDEAVVSRHRILSAIGMADAAMGRKYTSIEECLAAMNTVLAVLEDESKIAYAECDNDLFLEIRKYSVEFSRMMYDLSYRLPGKIVVNFSGGVHPLVASYVIYKDAKRHRELEERNVIDANGRFGPVISGIAPV